MNYLSARSINVYQAYTDLIMCMQQRSDKENVLCFSNNNFQGFRKYFSSFVYYLKIKRWKVTQGLDKRVFRGKILLLARLFLYFDKSCTLDFPVYLHFFFCNFMSYFNFFLFYSRILTLRGI